MTDLTEELKILIIESLDLEDTTPDDIDAEAPLFIEGLGLDSIDALEIGVALQKKYDVKLSTKGDDLKEHFYSVRTIANYISSHLSQQ